TTPQRKSPQTTKLTQSARWPCIEYDIDAGSMRVSEADDGLQWMYSFWFAWYALHPETDVYSNPTL
ncbi:MAG: hypothetical protein O3A29_00610, partial [Planctomycetota bacterium]|nr:hypothetical protein [Planctomycetota bacterium]